MGDFRQSIYRLLQPDRASFNPYEGLWGIFAAIRTGDGSDDTGVSIPMRDYGGFSPISVSRCGTISTGFNPYEGLWGIFALRGPVLWPQENRMFQSL